MVFLLKKWKTYRTFGFLLINIYNHLIKQSYLLWHLFTMLKLTFLIKFKIRNNGFRACPTFVLSNHIKVTIISKCRSPTISYHPNHILTLSWLFILLTILIFIEFILISLTNNNNSMIEFISITLRENRIFFYVIIG